MLCLLALGIFIAEKINTTRDAVRVIVSDRTGKYSVETIDNGNSKTML
jgi:hypothetical protein